MNTVLFELWSVQLTLLEACAIIASFCCLITAVYEKIATFPLGLLCTTLYFVFFYQHQLYASMLLQCVFFGFNIFGYYQWTHPQDHSGGQLKMSWGTHQQRINWVIVIVFGSLLLGFLTMKLDKWGLVLESAQYPILDALVTVSSILAQYLLSIKKIENWILWIVVDLLACVLYFISKAPFTAVLYAVFVFMAVAGWLQWKKIATQNSSVRSEFLAK